jgi:hypothetical protein
MTRLGPTGRGLRRAAIAALAVAGLAGSALAGPAQAAPRAPATTSVCTSPAGAVSCSPAPGTPALTTGPGTGVQQVRQIVQCGNTMYAVGNFASITGYDASTRSVATFQRHNAFSFAATAPFAVSSWNPDVNGQVNSVAMGGGHCSTAYLGGSFSTVRGVAARDIAAVTATGGRLDRRFGRNANHTVETLVLNGSDLLTGGFFTSINGTTRNYYASLNDVTGAVDGYLHLHISGHYQYRGVNRNGTRIYDQQLSPRGGRLLAEGDFTSVGGKSRQQIFMLALGRRHATVTSWRSAEFLGHCMIREPFYIRAAAWSPSGTTVYIADTGFRGFNEPAGANPRTGLCDAAAAFPAANQEVGHIWINYTGCDSMYSAAAGPGIAYFGGHERWADNPDNCNVPGPTAVPAPGMVGLSAADGSVAFDPTRSRGLGADDMLLTKSGLWIASDTYDDQVAANQWCGTTNGQRDLGHAGLCLLPY